MDLGLIAVGTAQSGEIRLRNVGTVPLAFAMVQGAAAAGTAAEAAAEESRATSLLRNLLLSQQQQQQQPQHQPQHQQRRPDNHQHNQQGPDGPFATATTGATQQHSEGGNDQALARVFSDSPLPPPPPPAANPTTPMTKHALTDGSLQRRNSDEGSVGSADSFSVSRDGCRLGFEPALGELAPGRSVTIAVRWFVALAVVVVYGGCRCLVRA